MEKYVGTVNHGLFVVHSLPISSTYVCLLMSTRLKSAMSSLDMSPLERAVFSL